MSKSDTIWRRLGNRGWWLPVVTAVLGFLGATVFNHIRTPVYEAITVVEITPYPRVWATSIEYQQYIQAVPVYDEVARRLEISGGSGELAEAVQVRIAGYNPQTGRWAAFWQRQLPYKLSIWLARRPLPPPFIEIRVQHTDPIISSQIGPTLVDVYNEYERGVREAFVVSSISEFTDEIHSTLAQLTLSMENETSGREQAAWHNKLDELLQSYAAFIATYPLPVLLSPPLAVVEPPTVPVTPIDTKLNLLLGTSAGAYVGFILYAARGKQNE
jgi:hypothetical protein